MLWLKGRGDERGGEQWIKLLDCLGKERMRQVLKNQSTLKWTMNKITWLLAKVLNRGLGVEGKHKFEKVFISISIQMHSITLITIYKNNNTHNYLQKLDYHKFEYYDSLIFPKWKIIILITIYKKIKWNEYYDPSY